jgi:hypothetical protein
MGSNKTQRVSTGRRRATSKEAEQAPDRENWRSLLAGASPREVLARLMNGDPLGLRRLVGERMRRRAYLLDANQVQLRAVARCARFAVRYRGQPAIDRWLADIVDEAMGDLVTEEQERARDPDRRLARPPGRRPDGGVFQELSRPLRLDPARMRAACARFNRLSEDERSMFFALVIESRSLDEVARSRKASASAVARSARKALDTLLETPRKRLEQAPS